MATQDSKNLYVGNKTIPKTMDNSDYREMVAVTGIPPAQVVPDPKIPGVSEGEKIEAMLKQLNYMQMNGQIDLIAEMDAVIGKWLAEKR